MTRVSIIIPTLNEAAALPDTLAAVALRAGDELIVCDGGSEDETCAIARSRGAKVVESPGGRAEQCNRGAAASQGDALLFLHADTRLPPDALDAVRHAMADPRNVGGAFRLRIADAGPALRLVAAGVNLRSGWLRMPYGDQALFVRREIFDGLGGFRPLAIMEDVDLVRRLRSAGRLVLLRRHVVTSARRWRTNGVWRTTVTNLAAMWMYRRGRASDDIRAFYDRRLRDGKSHGRPPSAPTDAETSNEDGHLNEDSSPLRRCEQQA